MLFYLSQYALDIMFGVSWWVVKKTTDGVYYLLYDNSITKKEMDESYQPILITKEDFDTDNRLEAILEELKHSRKDIEEMKKVIRKIEVKVEK